MSSTTSTGATEGWTKLFKSKDAANNYKLAEQLTGLFAGPLIDQSGIVSEKAPIVLDNACGTGIISSTLNGRLNEQARQNCKLTCGDFSEAMLEYTRQRAVDEGWPNTEVKVIDAQDTHLPSDYYTHVFAAFAFPSLPDYQAALKECYRVLQPGGTLASTTWAGGLWLFVLESTIKSLSSDLPFPSAEEYHEIFNKGWNLEHIVQSRFEDAGFTDVKANVVTAQVSVPVAQLVQLNKSALPVILGKIWTEEQRKEYEGRIPEAMRVLLEARYGVEGAVPLEPAAVVAIGRKL
ncbi:S-adenosyl-L-methionine-dependent methyltransferase [Aspergillus karnatakaensis]|uniref:gliotoxin thiomethyltransferase n=1 Tax=Aspergillus karnatakaensis TaxID=1810916 RepID=UPI003CCD7FB2